MSGDQGASIMQSLTSYPLKFTKHAKIKHCEVSRCFNQKGYFIPDEQNNKRNVCRKHYERYHNWKGRHVIAIDPARDTDEIVFTHLQAGKVKVVTHKPIFLMTDFESAYPNVITELELSDQDRLRGYTKRCIYCGIDYLTSPKKCNARFYGTQHLFSWPDSKTQHGIPMQISMKCPDKNYGNSLSPYLLNTNLTIDQLDYVRVVMCQTIDAMVGERYVE